MGHAYGRVESEVGTKKIMAFEIHTFGQLIL